MFIVIDWIDGAGKWTQVALLKENLEKMWKKVALLDFPRYGEKSAYFVEQYLNGKYGEVVDPYKASLFYAMDRFDASFQIKKYIEEYDYIISNRYVSASMIHQSWKIKEKKELESYLEWIDNLEFEILWIPRPDKIIFLDVNPEVSAKLIEKKEQRAYITGGTNKDIHENDDNHLKDAYNVAFFVAKKFSWEIVDCTKDWEILPKEEITKKILSVIL